MQSNVGRHKGVKSELLDRDAEFGELAFVGFDHIGVSFSDLFEFRLDLANGVVLDPLDLLQTVDDDP